MTKIRDEEKIEKLQKSQNKKNRKSLDIKIVNKLMFILIISCCVFYLFGMNRLSVKGFELRSARNKLAEINDENDKLQLNIMSLESYSLLNNKIGTLGMVKVDKFEYLNSNAGVVAKK